MNPSTEATVPETPRSGTAGPMRWLGQFILYGLFAIAIGVFSHWPSYHPLGADEALIKVSVSHLGQPVGECRRLSEEELAKLPPNMRFPLQCPRERSPLTMEVDIGGANVLKRVAAPTGLSRDSSSSIYERIVVPAGEQRIDVRFNDDVRPGAPTYERRGSVTLVPGQVLVIDFNAEKAEIIFE